MRVSDPSGADMTCLERGNHNTGLIPVPGSLIGNQPMGLRKEVEQVKQSKSSAARASKGTKEQI